MDAPDWLIDESYGLNVGGHEGVKMNRKITRGIATLALAGVLVGGGALSASAVTTGTKFDGVANRFQQSRYFEYQTRTTTSASTINFSNIGGGYTMNVKAQNGNSGTEYTEKKGLGTAYTYGITNSTPKGTTTRLIVTNNKNVTVTVSIAGTYVTN